MKEENIDFISESKTIFYKNNNAPLSVYLGCSF